MNVLIYFVYVYFFCEFVVCANGQIDSSGISTVVVELGIVCDKEYSQAFEYDENKIKTYVRNMVDGLNIDYQTLTSVRISFVITSIFVITDTYMQPFIEHVRSTNGQTDTATIAPLFRKWAYQKEIANNSDVVLLLTGSQGQYRSTTSADGLCRIDHANKEHDSCVIVRTSRSVWVFQKELSHSIARLFGANLDRDTTCMETGLLMSNYMTTGTWTHNYFSKCSDTDISRKIQSSAAACLRSTRALNYGQGSRIANVSVTFSEQCNLRYGSIQTATSHPSTESCVTTTCYITSPNGTATPVGVIFPLHYTPCRKTGICFRGKCLNPGSMLIQPKSQNCLVPSQEYADTRILKLASCPKRPYRYDKFSVDHFSTLGTLIVATDNSVYTELHEKCLAIKDNSLQIFYKRNYTSLIMGKTMWDLLEIGDGTSEVLICNRVFKACLSTNSNSELVLSKGVNSDVQSKRWKFEEFDLAENEPGLNNIPVESQYIARGYLRIILVCDMNCGKIFKFNETAAELYMTQILADAKSKFETLTSASVSLFVTSAINLWTHEVPGFFDVDATYANETLETIYTSFGKWAFKQLASSLPRFDVAVLLTAGITNGPKTYSKLSTACKRTSNMLEASLILKVDKYKERNCGELADAIAKIISSSNTPESCTCTQTQNPYFFTKCRNQLVWDFLNSDNAVCLKDAIKESELHSMWAHRGTHVPSFQEQCNFNRRNLDLIVKKEDENCFETPCRENRSFHGIVRNLYPLHGTPCGADKYCVRGRCIEKGYQLQHFLTESCITGAKLFCPYDRVYAAPCHNQESFSFLDHFKITPIEGNGRYFVLSTASFHTNGNKCLTVNTKKEYLQYRPCSELNADKQFVWNFREVDESDEHFLLTHNQTRKCVKIRPLKLFLTSTNHTMLDFIGLVGTSSAKYDTVNTLYLTSNCQLNDISLQWRKYPSEKISTERKIPEQLTEPSHGEATTVSITLFARQSTTKQSITKPSSTKPSTVKPSTVKPSTVKPSTVKPSTVKPSTVKPSTAKPSTVKPSTTKQIPAKNTEYIVTPTHSTPAKTLESEVKNEVLNPWKYVVIVIGIIFGVALMLVTTILVTRKYFLRRPPVSTAQEENKNYKWLLGEDFYQGKLSSVNPELSMTDQVDLLPFDARWEIPFDRIFIGKMIGGGAFGNVFNGKIMKVTPNSETVAIKVISANADTNHFSALKSELKILSNMGRHLNIVNLVGACTKQFNRTGKLYMIIEYCKFGNLRDFVLNNRKHFINNQRSFDTSPKKIQRKDNPYFFHRDFDKSKEFSTQDLIFWAFQTACGMEYLASKRVLHGDLAARNILLAENNVAKICDFGLSKELTRAYNYNYKKDIENAKVPYKWMAIESLKCGVFSVRSDRWSFGVVLWELFSLGDTPYPGVQINDKFIDQLSNGYRMEKPAFAPLSVYNVMLQCWSEDPNFRPGFSSLAAQFNKMLPNELCEYYDRLEFNFSDQTYAAVSFKGKGQAGGPSALEEDYDGYLSARPSTSQSVEIHSDFGSSPDIEQFVSGVCNLLDNKQGFHYVK